MALFQFNLSKVGDFARSLLPREEVQSDRLSSYANSARIEAYASAERNPRTDRWDVYVNSADFVAVGWPMVPFFHSRLMVKDQTPAEVVKIFDRAAKQELLDCVHQFHGKETPVERQPGNYRQHPTFQPHVV